MAVDIHLHILTEDVTEEDLTIFSRNHVGSKYESSPMFDEKIHEKVDAGEITKKEFRASVLRYEEEGEQLHESGRYAEADHRVSYTPAVYIGELSWLKENILGTEECVPDAVGSIYDLVGEDLPTIDKDFIAMVKGIYKTAQKHPYYKVNSCRRVVKFLNKHRGYQCFTLSW